MFPLGSSRRRSAPLAVASLCLLVANPLWAADRFWNNPTGGRWSTASDWLDSQPPGLTDRARFVLPTNGPVLFMSDPRVQSLSIGSDARDVAATFNTNGRVLTVVDGSLGMASGASSFYGDLTATNSGRIVANEFAVDYGSRVNLTSATLQAGRYLSSRYATPENFIATTRLSSYGRVIADEFDASGLGYSIVEVVSAGRVETGSAILGSAWPIATGTAAAPMSRILVSGGSSTWTNAGDFAIVGAENEDVTDYARLSVASFGLVDIGGRLTTTPEGQVHVDAYGTLEAGSLALAPGTLKFAGGRLRVVGAGAPEGTVSPGLVDVGNSTLGIGGSGSESTLEFGDGAYEDDIDTLVVGTSAGRGALDMSGNSSLTTDEATIGDVNDGRVGIGAGSSWINEGTIRVRRPGFYKSYLGIAGYVETDVLESSDPEFVGVYGAGTLKASRVVGSYLHSGGTLETPLVVGKLTQGGGVIKVGEPYGVLTIQGDANFAGGYCETEIGGYDRGVDYDYVDIQGKMSVGGTTWRIRLRDGFQPKPGDRFDLFDFRSQEMSIAGTEIPNLANGAKWAWKGFYNEGIIAVNHAATATALAPTVLECVDGKHTVDLATTVNDLDGTRIDVVWSVKNAQGAWVVVETDGRVPRGSAASFTYDYPHGVTEVRAEVKDEYQTTTVATTVTVQDTAAPLIVVAPDVVVACDPGEAFASGVVLEPATATDTSGHEVTVKSDAPPTYPLGENFVTWTATDKDGNVATGRQKVTVEDRESPQIDAEASVEFFSDPGKVVSTRRPPLPTVSDNVDAPQAIRIESDAPAEFPLGTTKVTFTATDAAGNSVQASTDVIVHRYLRPPTIEADVEEGETLEATVGETLTATFIGTDPDGEALTVTATGLPDGAELTPSSGTTSASPMTATIDWAPTPLDFGSSHDVTITFDDGYAGGKVSRSFTIAVAENGVPTVEPLDPVTLECKEGQHSVTLETTVDDADGDPLTVTWKIDGEIAKTENAEPGATIRFTEDYDHGVREVVVEVSDGYDLATAGTTITVQDTKAPILIVAADMVVGTDSGEDYASNVVLTPPTATDESGHELTVESDEQWSYPVGETIVTWTARDPDGNVATGQQKVMVVDLEKPLIGGAAIAKFNVDPGKIFSTQRPPEPAVSDNVSDVSSIRVESDAPARFPIGRTRVTFTAIDDGGNEAIYRMDVLVANRRPQAKAGRNVVVVTTKDRGAKVALDGSASSDVDAQRLKFAWSARGGKLNGATGAKPVGVFPIGTTTVTLTVTDPAGKSDTDTVDVKVRLKPAPLPRGQMASEAFLRAANQASTGLSARGSTNGHALSGLAYANAAASLAGREAMAATAGPPEPGLALLSAEASALQQRYAAAAVNSLIAAYAETGDESLLTAASHAAYGAAYAAEDLSER